MAPYDPKYHPRRSLRLKGYDYSQSGAYFVTISTYQHQSLFGAIVDGEMTLNSFGQVVREEWFKSARIRSEIELFADEFVVMLNHIHGIIWIVDDPPVGATRRVAPTTRRVTPASSSRPCGPKSGSIGAIIGQYKPAVTKRINHMLETYGVPVWQRNYHDHIIRDESELINIRNYIADNPRRWTGDRYHPEKMES